MQLYVAKHKKLCGSLRKTYRLSAIKIICLKCNEISQSRALTIKTLLSFFVYIFESLINTAPPASDSIYWQISTGKLML